MQFVNNTDQVLKVFFYWDGGSYGGTDINPGKTFTKDLSSFTDGPIRVGVTNQTFSAQMNDSQTMRLSLTGEG